jgi:hypothetical protein
MTITPSEIKNMKSAVNNGTAANGGRMSTIQAVSGVADAYFPRASNAERVAGRTWYAKRFVKVENAANETLTNAGAYLDYPTPADDKILLLAGTQTNTQGDLTGSEAKYGAGFLDAAVDIGDLTLVVNVDASAGADNIFRDGMRIRVSDKETPDALAGNESILTISGAPVVVGDQVTITVAAPGFDIGYASGAKVSGILEIGDIKCTVTGFTVNSVAGTYDDETYPVVGNNIGCIEDTITLTFTSSTAFNITSAQRGALGSGSVVAGAAPTNSDFGVAFWTLQAEGFGGAFVAGNTITFATHPASFPYFLKQVIPPNCNSLANNGTRLVVFGETVGE